LRTICFSENADSFEAFPCLSVVICDLVGKKASAGVVEAVVSAAGPCPAGRGSGSAEGHEDRGR